MDANVGTISINGVEYIQKSEVEEREMSGDYFIVRTYSAGVFAGNIVKRENQEVVMKNARRIWYWTGAASLSQLAMEGTSKPNDCKFPCAVEEVILTQAIEILKCTKKAEKSIKSVSIWKQ